MLSMVFLGCSPYAVKTPTRADRQLSESFIGFRESENGADVDREWWKAFGDPQLNSLMHEAFSENLSLQSAFERLAQARARAMIAGAEQYPSVALQSGGSRARIDTQIGVSQSGVQPVGVRYQNDFFVRSGISYELDLWERIASSRNAAVLRTEATVADLDQAALVLSGTTTELWFAAQEKQALLNLIRDQIDVSRTFLELIELRFSVGKATALDVLQQRSQLASIEAEEPRVLEEFEVTLNQLAAVLALPSREKLPVKIQGELPELPPFPKLISPAELLVTRPDLKSALLDAEATESDVAAAVAERFPQLALTFDYSFSTTDIADLFLTKVGSLGGDILLPLVDGGRRRGQVRLQKALSREKLLAFQQKYLSALQEVEDALSQEKNRSERVVRLSEQLELSRKTLNESRSRYATGLTDYLDVIVAVQSLQQLERTLVSEKRNLLIARARLYRALGGGGALVSESEENEQETPSRSANSDVPLFESGVRS